MLRIPLKYAILLLRNKMTLMRALTEIELEQLETTIESTGSLMRVLLAGGTGKNAGSERALLEQLHGKLSIIALNIDSSSRPHILADLNSPWPLKDGTFDLVVCTWVLEHLREPAFFFQQAYRVLASGGAVIITVPFIYRIHGSPCDYWRFTDTALQELAKGAGFNCIEVKRVGGGPFLTAISLIWPILQPRVLGVLLALLAAVGDAVLVGAIRLLKKGQALVDSFPMAYILSARKF